MKKFEEELKDNNLEVLVGNTFSPLYGQLYLNYDAVVELSEGWVSPEDHQAEVDKRKQQYEDHQEIYSKTAKKLNEVELELSKLKSQLEKQQPEIPEFVAKAVEEFKKQPDSYKGFLNDNKVCTWLNEYQMNNDDFGICGLNNKFFVLAHFAINGYTVAKEKRFYLKHIDMSKKYNSTVCVLAHGEGDVIYGHYEFPVGVFPSESDYIFTQSQIDNMETGSYEQIEVTE